MTQKEIKELIESDEQRLKETLNGYKYDQEYQEVCKELEQLQKKKARLEKRQIEIKLEYEKDHKEDIEFAHEELRYSRGLLRKARMGLDPSDYNDDLQKMFKAFHQGNSWEHRKRLHWVSDDGCYAIFKIESDTVYIDRGSGSRYSPARWYLFKIDDIDNDFIDGEHDLCIWYKEGGRWGSKKDMKFVEQAIEEYENNK